MKTTDPIHPIVHLESTPVTQGIDLLTHMSIEFTKALLGIQYGSMDACVANGIWTAKELIKQLNDEKDSE